MRGTARPAAAPGSGQGVYCTPSWRSPDLIGLPARPHPMPIAVASQVPRRGDPGAAPLRQPRERRQIRGDPALSTVVDDPQVRPLPQGVRGRRDDNLKHRRHLDRPGCLRCLRTRGNHRGGEEQRDDDRHACPPAAPCRARQALRGHEVTLRRRRRSRQALHLSRTPRVQMQGEFAGFEPEVIIDRAVAAWNARHEGPVDNDRSLSQSEVFPSLLAPVVSDFLCRTFEYYDEVGTRLTAGPGRCAWCPRRDPSTTLTRVCWRRCSVARRRTARRISPGVVPCRPCG